jgi:hypothetical protein
MGRRLHSLAAIVALALLFNACATKPLSISDQQRMQFGRVTVTAAERSAKPAVAGPTPLGAVGGGVVGGAKGVGLSALFATGCFVTLGYAWVLCAGALATPYWIGRGMVEGAMNAVPDSERRLYQAAIAAAAADAGSAALVERILDEGQRRAAPQLVRDEPDSVAEIALMKLGLEPVPHTGKRDVLKLSVPDVDPQLHLVAEMRLRVVSAVDKREVIAKTYRHLSGQSARLAEWGTDDGARFRDEVDQASQSLARQAADDLFGTAPDRVVPENDPGPAASVPTAPCQLTSVVNE